MTGPLGPLAGGQTRAALLVEVARALEPVRDSAQVIVACSGGPDSTALAFLVAEARPDLDLQLVHVRHGLRDDAPDVGVVTSHASWLEVPLQIMDVEVVSDGRGTEAAAREARYAALRSAAAAAQADAVLVGHTADDQAETVLLRLARGTGIDGLGAMEVISGDLIRPMLRLRREDVHRFVELEGLPSCEDPTNRDPQVRRAVVRHELLPALQRVAPDPVAALVRLAALARDDAAALDAACAPGLALVRRVGSVRAIPDRTLALAGGDAAAAALARRVVRAVLTELGGEAPDASTVLRVLALEPGSAASLPGPVEVSSAGGWRAFSPRTLLRVDAGPVAVPGRTAWPPVGGQLIALVPGHPDPDDEAAAASDHAVQVSLEIPGAWTPPPAASAPSLLPPGARPERMAVALPSDVGPMVVRHRQPGDQVRTAAGTRSLQDLMVDEGVPRAIRELWPVVTASEQVIWIPGFAADEQLLRAGRRAPGCQLRLVAVAPGLDGA